VNQKLIFVKAAKLYSRQLKKLCDEENRSINEKCETGKFITERIKSKLFSLAENQNVTNMSCYYHKLYQGKTVNKDVSFLNQMKTLHREKYITTVQMSRQTMINSLTPSRQ